MIALYKNYLQYFQNKMSKHEKAPNLVASIFQAFHICWFHLPSFTLPGVSSMPLNKLIYLTFLFQSHLPGW